MVTQLPAAVASLIYAEKLRELHRFYVEGRADSVEADALRDEMDAPGYALTEKERERMNGLSEDFYALAEVGVKQVALSPNDRRQWAKDLGNAVRGEDWDAALQILRRAPSDVPVDRILFAQAWCWYRLQDVETALVFMREAVRRCPSPLNESELQASIP